VWTFDPLVARNAYFNLAVLGVEVVEYVNDAYSVLSDPDESSTPTTDRLVVLSNLSDPQLGDPGDVESRTIQDSEHSRTIWREMDDPSVRWLLKVDSTGAVESDDGSLDDGDARELCIGLPPSSDILTSQATAFWAAYRVSFRRSMTAAFEHGLRPVGVVMRSDGRVHGYHMSYGDS
jgi:predicted GNAT superfamily acetyltransferase